MSVPRINTVTKLNLDKADELRALAQAPQKLAALARTAEHQARKTGNRRARPVIDHPWVPGRSAPRPHQRSWTVMVADYDRLIDEQV